MKSSVLSSAALLAGVASAARNSHRLGRLVPPVEETVSLPVLHSAGIFANGTGNSTVSGNGTFLQLLDHKDPSAGTFSQRYWWNAQNCPATGCEGAVLFTPGEVAADGYGGYLRNTTITGLYAQEIKGVAIMIEHRYWGQSSPYPELDAKTLRYLTLDNAVGDLTYFANNVDLPFDTDHSANADKIPWVLSGGSYSGALSAWTASTDPGTFWAYHASSAPVEAIYDYWSYFQPVVEGMAANCSKDVSLVVGYLDNFLTTASDSDKTAMKARFGLEAITHDDDFMAVLENGPWLWQENSFYTGYSGFFQFCDAIENVTAGAAVTPDANGVGVEVALAGYANWVNTTIVPSTCEGYGYAPYDVSCFDTYDANNTLYTDRSVGNAADLQWNWYLCSGLAYWQDGKQDFIVSSLVTAEYWQRQCDLFFPPVDGYTYPDAKDPEASVAAINTETQGWNLENTTRLIWTNGEFDPWRSSGVSSEFRPGGPLASTPEHPVQVIPGGFHCSDLILANGKSNEGAQTVIDNEVAQIVAWVKEFSSNTYKRSRHEKLRLAN